mmetsp:Transcript_6941/g.9849  ORF Transcript_6941/g.9849 Transcript_6941/m.9849 type:complete len:106 (+) Transcript_6941:505-822(+)
MSNLRPDHPKMKVINRSIYKICETHQSYQLVGGNRLIFTYRTISLTYKYVEIEYITKGDENQNVSMNFDGLQEFTIGSSPYPVHLEIQPQFEIQSMQKSSKKSVA